jgi:hypothetical protein
MTSDQINNARVAQLDSSATATPPADLRPNPQYVAINNARTNSLR